MRELFQGDLAQLGEQLADMCGVSTAAMRQATRALLEADLPLAESVLSNDATLDARRAECEEHAQLLLALQAPVARDLRIVLAATYCAEKIERMGDLAAHIAEIARFAHPHHAVPDPIRETISELGTVTVGMAERLATMIDAVNTGSGGGAFAELKDMEDRVNRLHADILARISKPDFGYDPSVAANLALLTRFYERFADQAVSVAQRLDFAATGTLPAA
ncbi:MAG TPA: PhoU domain-containing protein [Pseudonocardiaceae bacterium]